MVPFVCPFVINVSRPDAPPAAWEPDRGTAIGLVPRTIGGAGEVRWLKAAPFFQFHFMNAFEEAGRVETVFPWFTSYSFGDRPDSGRRLELHRLTIVVLARHRPHSKDRGSLRATKKCSSYRHRHERRLSQAIETTNESAWIKF
ncbi:MAG TPA: carotenoid oxygenase family protein [Candidatus Binataceae bacterium]|nr:carotenoid oxygenase family protein [Candidatus Binataceae bacterium]